MRTLLLFTVLCVWCGLCFAQGEGPCNDSFCLTVSDIGCDPAGCTEFPPNGSTSQTFTVPCDGNYNFVAKLICQSGSNPCGNCNTCVWVYPTSDPRNVIGRIHTVNCNTGGCSFQDPNGLPLSEGVNYTMAVCLTPCPNYSCSECSGASCTAYGCIWLNITTECCPLSD